jgi:hypothetical protein
MNGSSSSCQSTETEPYRSPCEGPRADKNLMKEDARVEEMEQRCSLERPPRRGPKMGDLFNCYAHLDESLLDLRYYLLASNQSPDVGNVFPVSTDGSGYI